MIYSITRDFTGLYPEETINRGGNIQHLYILPKSLDNYERRSAIEERFGEDSEVFTVVKFETDSHEWVAYDYKAAAVAGHYKYGEIEDYTDI